MMTAEEAQRIRRNKASVNHDTYKSIYEKISNRIRAAAERGETSIRYKLPPFVPDRPIFDPSHALRYNRDKLRHLGFVVTEVDEDVLDIDWKKTAPKTTKKKNNNKKSASTAPAAPLATSFKSKESISEKLLDLKKRLKL